MNALRSEQLSRRLWLAMLVIVLSVALISLPLIAGSYRSYRSSAEALQEIQSLKMLAELSNKISRERAPANNAMSSPRAALPEQLQALQEYRAEVDLQIQRTAEVLKRSGFAPAALELERNFKPALALGRRAVDGYIALPDEQRRPQQLDQAIGGFACRRDDDQLVSTALLFNQPGDPAVAAGIGQTAASKLVNLTTCRYRCSL